MKVVAFTPQYLPVVGGIEIFVDALAQPLRHHSIETVVITDTDQYGELPRRDLVNNTVVHRLDFVKALRTGDAINPLKVLDQLFQLLQKESPDLIHVHSAVQFSAWYLQRLLRKMPSRPPLVVTQHGALAPVDHLKIVRELLLRADVLTAVSEAALQSATEFSNRISATSVIYNGVQRNGPAQVVSKISKLSLICVGRLEPDKGFDVAIEAFAKLRARGIDAELTLIGQGPERQFLGEVAIAHGVAEHVHLRGVLDHPTTLEAIANSSLVVIPSRLREGFSLVAVEAALFGVACVASRVGGLPEVIEDGVTGRLVAPGDPDTLALAMADLLGDAEELRRLGAKARQRAEQKFDMNRCVDSYVELYRSLIR